MPLDMRYPSSNSEIVTEVQVVMLQVEGSHSEQTGKADTARKEEVKDACSNIQKDNRPKGKHPDLV